MRKFIKVISFVLILSITLLTGCNRFFAKKYKFHSDKGIQLSGNNTQPLFSNRGYSSDVLANVEPREVDVKSVKDGWRKVNIDGVEGWLPPQSAGYNGDDSGVMIDTPVTSQFPELNNGCEAVSIKMFLDAFGTNEDKIVVADELPKDDTELQTGGNGEILVWGDPKVGFVGSMEGQEEIGYSIDPEPVVKYLKGYFENPVNLTGSDPSILERHIRAGIPVIVWVTVGFRDVTNHTGWTTEKGEYIETTFDTHAMTLVGFDDYYYYLNDPYTGTKNYSVSKDRFMEVWRQLGNKAVSVE